VTGGLAAAVCSARGDVGQATGGGVGMVGALGHPNQRE
jgi:hypothetical protein